MIRLKYHGTDGLEVTEVILEVPWNSHSGNIPPPYIEFYTGPGSPRLVFMYVGEQSA